jgi:type I restriction enzyme S subunit
MQTQIMIVGAGPVGLTLAAELARYGVRVRIAGDIDKFGRGCVWRDEITPCLHQNHVFAVRPHCIVA